MAIVAAAPRASSSTDCSDPKLEVRSRPECASTSTTAEREGVMAGRIRSIKPELREHLAFAVLTDRAARLFLMLYTIVDDEGRCPATPAFLAGNVFFARPCATNVIGKAIAELETANLVRGYSVNGAPFLEIVGWRVQGSVTHQRSDKPQPGRYPAPEWAESKNDSWTDSKTDSRTDLDQRPRPGPVPVPGPGLGEKRLAAVPPGLAGWKPPAGGKAEKAAAARVAAGELTQNDVERCWEACERKGVSERPNADAIAAKWIATQQPERANGRAESTPTDGSEAWAK
jgi:hypothetical protein